MLTTRDLEALRLLADGKRVKEIAHLLCISVKTVESHRHNIMEKLESTVCAAGRVDIDLISSQFYLIAH